MFEQFYLFIQKSFQFEGNYISEPVDFISEDLWAKEYKMEFLINQVQKRKLEQRLDASKENLRKLVDCHTNLDIILLDLEKFKSFKKEMIFKRYIKNIKFLPLFQYFGLGQYFLYIFPINIKDIDFKHLLHNSFQNIRFPLNIDNSNSFLIKFIWPYRNPNIALLNWLTKSKKIIREYCVFFIKRLYQLFHFNYNLRVNEWDLNPNHFKSYFQNILFNPGSKPLIPEFKEFNLGDLKVSDKFKPESLEFKSLKNIYSWDSIDLKSYMGTKKFSTIEEIVKLIDKKLIFPYITLKNIELIEEIHIILPNIGKELNKTILDIFSYFNIGFIYEIEGQYFIKGFSKEIKFENGLMINLFLPDCQIDDFEKLFTQIFSYFEIDHYLIFHNLSKGGGLLKSIYGNLDFLKLYNPLTNLIWNETDKIWMNHKLFNEKFDKVYPPL